MCQPRLNFSASAKGTNPKIAEKLFGSINKALDKKVTIDNVSFTIIGVMKSKGGGGFGGPDYDSYFFGPYTTGFIFDPDKKFIRFAMKTDENISISTVKEEVKDAMLKRYKDDEFSIVEPTEILSVVNGIFGIMNIVLVAIASISLLVGGAILTEGGRSTMPRFSSWPSWPLLSCS